MSKSRKDKLDAAYAAYEAAKTGTRPRQPAKAIQTHPVVPVPDLPEAEVLKQCLKWLKAHHILADRHDCGTGRGHIRFGIKGAGDIIAILDGGKHCEIECKRGRGGRLSVVQQKRMADIRAAEGVYEVVHGVEELQHYLGG